MNNAPVPYACAAGAREFYRACAVLKTSHPLPARLHPVPQDTFFRNQCSVSLFCPQAQSQGDKQLAMADNEEVTTPAAPEEQSQQEGGATRQHNSDSWVIVDDPDKPAETYVTKIAR